jgi:hypothetical protein
MTNVNQINETPKPLPGQGKDKAARTDGGGKAFDAMLTNALEKSEGGEGAAEVSALQELAAPGFELQSPSEIVSEKTEGLLGLLDTYAGQLGDPQVSLKSIAPVLEQMTAEAQDLMKEARFLDSGETELKDIATRAAVAAQTEAVKFQRGDYLS